MSETIHNVDDRRFGWIGSWDTEPLDIDKLTEADIGRTVIYRDHHRAEAGTLTSWRGEIVFARYSRGDTSAGAHSANLVFGVGRADTHPDTPSDAVGGEKQP
jgi:hypothetical protein